MNSQKKHPKVRFIIIFGYVWVALAACYDVGSCGDGETSEDPRVELGVGENFVKMQTEK